jgi:hypothetical protein
LAPTVEGGGLRSASHRFVGGQLTGSCRDAFFCSRGGRVKPKHENGLNSRPENLNNGLTHCFVLAFPSTAARDAYLIAPDHVAFADWVGDLVEHVTVVDYWTTVDPR